VIDQSLKAKRAIKRQANNEALPGGAAVVIPIYNHAQRLASVVEATLELGLPIIVVDDGSSDHPEEVLRPFNAVTLLRHHRNRGKGRALLTGFEAATQVAAWAVTIDADGQHNPADTVALFQAVTPGVRPIVVGCRTGMHRRQVVPWTSRFGRGFSNFWVRCAGGPRLADTQCGFRLYPLAETLCLPVRSRRFQFEVEVLVKAAWHGLPVVSAPVSVAYRPGGRRISHFHPFVDFCRNSAVFTRLIFQRVVVSAKRRRQI